MLAMMMPGPFEMAIIAIVAVLLFGPRLPRVARDVGGSVNAFKAGLKDTTEELKEAETLLKDATK
jgi:sec-independent protein translocase protein TatA